MKDALLKIGITVLMVASVMLLATALAVAFPALTEIGPVALSVVL